MRAFYVFLSFCFIFNRLSRTVEDAGPYNFVHTTRLILQFRFIAPCGSDGGHGLQRALRADRAVVGLTGNKEQE